MTLHLPSASPPNGANPFGLSSSYNLVGELESDAKGPLFTYFGTTPRPGFVVGRPHQGEDWLSPLGGPVLAIAPGLIWAEVYDIARGYHILEWYPTKAGGQLVACYQHLERYLAHNGQAIVAGQEIALSGASGQATGPHLHVETRWWNNRTGSRWYWQTWPAVSPLRILPGGDLAADPRFLPA